MTTKSIALLVLTTVALGGCASLSPVPGDFTATPHPANPQVYEHRLDNGLKVIVKEDHRAPVVVSQVWYKVGSSYEHSGITGVSHVLEHMMFKGTKQHPPGEFSRIIAANGGRENAFTGQDYTAYFQQLEKSRLPVSFELEADRMHNLVLREDEFRKEIQVVMEERRTRTEDNPQALTYEQFNAAAYVNSPYHAPVIGWMDDLENMTVDDLARWYQSWYAPNNATLVVVGDVKAAEVFALAERYFGDIPPAEIPKLKPRREIQQRGERRIKVKAPAQVPFLIMGYKTPSVVDAEAAWEPYALEMLLGILDGGTSARLTRELVRGQQIAASIGASYDSFSPHQEVFSISATPAQGVSVATLEQAIRRQLERLQQEPVSQDELERVKAQVVASKVYEKDSIFYQAMTIGMLETVGLGWPLGEQYVDRLKAVTAEQVQAVARKYFHDDTLTVAVLEPQTEALQDHTEGNRHAH